MTSPRSEILLIEDNPADRELISVLLTDRDSGGWHVTSCATLSDGLNTLRSDTGPPDFVVILLDLSLPDSFGLQTLAEVQSASQSLPIVVLTGNSDRSNALEAVRRGAQDYLFKDSLTSELLAKSLQYAIERKQLELKWRGELESRVRERTAELAAANRDLELQIAERRAAESALDESRRFVESVMNAAPVIVFILDLPMRRITYVNDQLDTILGLTPDDIRQCDDSFLARIIHQDDLESTLKWIRRLGQTRTNNIQEAAMRVRAADGTWRWLLTRCVPFRRGTDGEVRLILGTAQDITDRQRAEEEARQRQEQLVFVTRQAMLGEFASAMAHELTQPLMAAANYSQTAVRRLNDVNWSKEQLADCLDKAVQQTLLAGEIIRRLRHLVAKRPVERRATNITETIHETVEMIRPLAESSNVHVRCDIADELPLVHVDRIQIQQVLLNLLRNGLDAMHDAAADDRCLSVRAAPANADEVEISVSDQGVGCDLKQLNQLFEPFFTTKEQGLGMGLPISRSIIEAHGGHLIAQPNRARGLTLRLTLPLKPGEIR